MNEIVDTDPIPQPEVGQVWVARRAGSWVKPRRVTDVEMNRTHPWIGYMFSDNSRGGTPFIATWNAWVRKHNARPIPDAGEQG